MTAGIIQLVAKGREDIFLTRDPQITFYKVVYRRHTNFSQEDIPQYFIQELDFGKKATCILSASGDLINKMCLKITLPEINNLSSSNTSNIYPDVNKIRFAWIRKIGFAMIKNIEVEIDGKLIDRHYGEWMYIWSMLTTRNIADDGLNKLVGDIPELTNFTEHKNEYTLYIPIYFWFCRASGMSLPIVNLQYSDVKINIELYELDECCIILPTNYIKCDCNIDNFEQYEYLQQNTPDGISRYGIFSHYDVINKRLYYTNITREKFVSDIQDNDINILPILQNSKYNIVGMSSGFIATPSINTNSVIVHHKTLSDIRIPDSLLLVGYVFIDNEERAMFAKTKNDYLIEQLYFTPNISIGAINSKVQLNIDQPCKLMVWVAQLDYINDFNDRFNYTDSHVIKNKNNQGSFYDTLDNVNVTTQITEMGNTLIDTTTIRLNSQERLTKRSSIYFEKIQPFQHSVNTLPKGCEMYSYSLFPTEVSPSGTTNMSQIELIELNLKMNYKISPNNKAKFRAYSLCYNVWRNDSGLSALVFIR
jgi:hypothetical protein